MKYNRKIYSVILLVLVWGLTNAVIGLVTSDPKVDIVVDNDGPYYEVNEQGDLTIQLHGITTGVIPSDCVFELRIPNEFNMTTLLNGTPVIKMLNEGTPLETSVNGYEINSIFALRTYNSTVLPISYNLKITSPEKNFSKAIIPKWPDQSLNNQEGGGAGIAAQGPLTSFYAYDSYKGNTEHVKTYIYNPLFYQKEVDSVEYKIFADDYDDWEDWTQAYSEGGYINGYQTYVVHDYLDYIFTAQSSKKYALNSGTYTVTRVKASGAGPGGYWSSTYTPSSSQGEFEVTVESGTHPVFVVHLVDSYFKNAHSNYLTWFNHIETKSYSYQGSPKTLKSHFGIDFTSMVFTWNPSSDDISYLYNYVMRPTAKNALGLTSDWKQDPSGTQAVNHGFDMLFAHRYKMNTNGDLAGMIINEWNQAILMKGYYISIYPRYIDQTLGTMHESLHTFNCNDRSAWWYVMSGYNGGYTMHSTTVSEIDLTTYDGV